MKCPLTYRGKLESYQGREYGVLSCLKEECAWWSNLAKKCKIDLIECQLDGIRTALFDIAEKKGG